MDQKARPSDAVAARSKRHAWLAPALLFAAALLLAVLIHFAAPWLVFGAAPVAGLVGAGACELLARSQGPRPSEEPWRFDGYGLLVAGLAVPALGASVGSEATPVAWLFVTALAGVGTTALLSRTPDPGTRPPTGLGPT